MQRTTSGAGVNCTKRIPRTIEIRPVRPTQTAEIFKNLPSRRVRDQRAAGSGEDHQRARPRAEQLIVSRPVQMLAELLARAR